MLLKTKFLLLLVAIFIGLLLVNLSTLALVIFPAFEGLESREAKKNMGRVIDILESDFKDLDGFVYDWAAWDDTYQFAKDQNQTYIDTNILADYSVNQNRDLYYAWDTEGKPLLNKALNREGDGFVSFDDFPADGLPENHPFHALDKINSGSSGLILTSRGPMIIAARPISQTSLNGPVRGVLAMGRYLDKPVIESIVKRSGLDIDVWSLAEKKLPGIPADAPRDIEPGKIKIIITEDETNSFVYSSYPDIYGNPLILIRVSMPRDIVAQGKSTIKYGIGMAIVSGFVLMLVLLFILQRSIIFPLSSLAQNILRLGKKEDVAQQFPVNRSDELGMVARSVIESNQERIRAEEKLTVYSKDLKRRNDELKEFTSIASHDLQEPLRKIALFGDRLNEGVSQVTQKDYLQRMISAASRMQTLINDLLDLSGIDLFARPFQSVDLEKVVGEVLEDLELIILEAQASVEVGSLPTLYAEPSQMKQLFQNLIANAIKYHKKDEPSIVILNSQKNDLEFWRITVKDNGIGFDEKYCDKILKPFQRLHGRSEYEGTGIGLAICDKIITRHNGHITCKSTLGEGSTFIVSLPEKPA
jgi:signal transduction histidine kinase